MAEKVAFEGKRQLRWLQAGNCFVTYLESDVEFDEALWNKWLEALAAAPGDKRMLCSWGDIQPSKEQWRRATRLMREAGKPIAVVTESRHTSALAKAASWLGIEMQAFRWRQLIDASTFLGLERQERMALRAKVTALRDSFGAVVNDAEASSMNVSAGVSAGPAPRSDLRIEASSSRPVFSPSRPASAPEPKPRSAKDTAKDTPMAAAASKNLENVRRTSEEIQAKLAEIQARLRNRAPINVSKS
jgi:hypothetical protein